MRTPKAKTIGSIIDSMVKLRDERSALSAKDKILKEEYDALQVELIAALQEQGTVQGSSVGYTASISQSTIFTITNFDAWVAFANKNKLTHAFYKQVSAPAIREYAELHKGKIPEGLEPFNKMSISLTARN